MTSITRALGTPGKWTIDLVPDTPDWVREILDDEDGWLIVTDRLPEGAYTTSDAKARSIYSGRCLDVEWAEDESITLTGDDLMGLVWRPTGTGPAPGGDLGLTWAQVVSHLNASAGEALNGLQLSTVGTISATGLFVWAARGPDSEMAASPVTQQTVQLRRRGIEPEWRVRPTGVLQVGPTLGRTTPIVLCSTELHTDLVDDPSGLIGLRARLRRRRSSRDRVTAVRTWDASGNVRSSTTAARTGWHPSTDLDLEDWIESSSQADGSASEATNRAAAAHRERVSRVELGVTVGYRPDLWYLVEPGDQLLVWGPRQRVMGGPAVVFGGRTPSPLQARCQAITIGLPADRYSVLYSRNNWTANSLMTDLTEWVRWDTSGTVQLEVGAPTVPRVVPARPPRPRG